MKNNLELLMKRVDKAKKILLNTLNSLTSQQNDQQEMLATMVQELDSHKQMLETVQQEKATFVEGSDKLKISLHELLTAVDAYCTQIENYAEVAA